MADNRFSKLAQILVNYSTAVKKGDLVVITGWFLDLTPETVPLLREVYLEVLKAGGHPHLQMNLPEQDYLIFSTAEDFQLEFVSPIDDLIYKTFDVQIMIEGATNLNALESVDPNRIQLAVKARKELKTVKNERSAEGSFRWGGTVYPTSAFAQNAKMSVTEATEFLFRTTHADEEDPVAFWVKQAQDQQKIIDWFKGKREVHIKGEGIDLSMSIVDRIFINGDGTRNMPCGEIFTGPVEESVNGRIRFSYPCIWLGNEVEGVELVFDKGKVIKATAEKNDNFLQATLDVDEGARYLGEFGIGTNYGVTRFVKNMLFDEKMGGTIHLALGAGYPESGSKNQSGLHWDMLANLNKGGQILVDDELIYENGKFILD